MSQIQHMALIKFKPEVTPSKIEQIFNSLAQLQHLIPGGERKNAWEKGKIRLAENIR